MWYCRESVFYTKFRTHWSVAQAGSNDEKTGGWKCRWTVPVSTAAKSWQILLFEKFTKIFHFKDLPIRFSILELFSGKESKVFEILLFIYLQLCYIICIHISVAFKSNTYSTYLKKNKTNFVAKKHIKMWKKSLKVQRTICDSSWMNILKYLPVRFLW